VLGTGLLVDRYQEYRVQSASVSKLLSLQTFEPFELSNIKKSGASSWKLPRFSTTLGQFFQRFDPFFHNFECVLPGVSNVFPEHFVGFFGKIKRLYQPPGGGYRFLI